MRSSSSNVLVNSFEQPLRSVHSSREAGKVDVITQCVRVHAVIVGIMREIRATWA